MVIGGVFLRQPALVGKRHEIATGLAHAQVQLFGMGLPLPGQMLEARPPAVHGLQQVEVANVGDAGLP